MSTAIPIATAAADTAVVVGASSGLGRALATELARRGHAVLLVASDRRDVDALAADLQLRHGVPARALALQGVWASVLALSGRYGQLLDYVIATALLFYALTVIGLLRLRARHGHAGRSRVLPLAYVAAAPAVCVDLLVVKPEFTWPGFVLVALGVPVYLVWRRRD